MEFSGDDINDAIMQKHKDDIAEDGFKKYVVCIRNEFVEQMDAMSVEERNNVINDIIELHRDEVNEKKQIKSVAKIVTSIIVIFAIMLFLAPVILWLVNESFNSTKDSYNQMQKNFEVLYDKGKK